MEKMSTLIYCKGCQKQIRTWCLEDAPYCAECYSEMVEDA